MSARHVMLFIFACIIGGGVYVYAMMSMPTAEVVQTTDQAGVATVAPPQNSVKILVVKEDTPAGTLIAQPETKFEFKDWPSTSMNSDAYVSEGNSALADFTGSVVRVGMRAGEPVVRSNIIKRGESGFLAAVLAPGMRAVSMQVSSVTGVAGFIFPGDHIDLVLSHTVEFEHQDSAKHTHSVSETILQGVRVIAVDQRSSDQEQLPVISNVVTVEVTSDQAERIALAQKMGELRAVLRSMVREDGSTENSNDPTAPDSAQPTANQTFTLDSDLSQVISPPGGAGLGASGADGSVQLVRGNTATEIQPK